MARNPTPWQQLTWSDLAYGKKSHTLTATYLKWSHIWQEIPHPDSNLLEVILHMTRNPTPWQQCTWSDLAYDKNSHTVTATYLKWSCLWQEFPHTDRNLLEVISGMARNPTPWQQLTWSDLMYGKKSHTLTVIYLKWSHIWQEIPHPDSSLLEVISHDKKSHTLTAAYLKWSHIWQDIPHPDSNLLEVSLCMTRNPTPWQ